MLDAPVGEDGKVHDVIELGLLVDGQRTGGGRVGVHLPHLVPVLHIKKMPSQSIKKLGGSGS